MRFRVSMKLYNWAPHFLYQMPQWETERVVFRAVFGPGTIIYFQKEVRSCHISQACDSFLWLEPLPRTHGLLSLRVMS